MNTTQILVVTLATPAVSVLLFLLRRLEDGLPGPGPDVEPAAQIRPQAALRTGLAYGTQLTGPAVPVVSDGGMASGSGPPP